MIFIKEYGEVEIFTYEDVKVEISIKEYGQVDIY